jgi:phosphoglycerol transferase MdoB-like AlkP superfamily enzyme
MAIRSRKRAIAAVLQAFLLGVALFGVVTGGASTVVTAGIALFITFVPALLHREFGYSLNSELLVLLTLAVSIHTAGAMGLYERFTWFDNIAHTVSAMVVAGIGYAGFRALELHSPEIDVPGRFRFLFILVFVLATGVFWEVIEFALGDLMTVYGVNDIVTDMVFNLVGAVIVAVWGTTHLGGLVGFFVRRLRG